jgi:DNA topoisomerase-1
MPKAKNLHRFMPCTDPNVSAKTSGLRYVTDTDPGIKRQRTRTGFRFYDAKGRPVRDLNDLRRIKSLAIPPAWTAVWINPLADGHLQATGRDARRRKQYRYHPRWREVRDETKYARMMVFGQLLPRLRAQVAEDLARPGLPRAKVIAAVVKLLESTLIRVGNEEYARQNNSFGLTTMRNKHVKVSGSKIRFHFRGKSGIGYDLDLQDRRLAGIVKRCQDLPGQELFQYVAEDGLRCAVDSSDVNDYLRAVMGENFTAKDFRTWVGTVLAARALLGVDRFDSQASAKRNIVKAIESVAKRLGNTRAICRKSYIHPAVVNAYLEGSLTQTAGGSRAHARAGSQEKLSMEEAAVMAILEEQAESELKKKVA